MANLVKPRLETLTGLKAESDFYLAYVPERIAPGRALQEFVESPRLVGGIGPNSTRVTSELFGAVCKSVIETDAATAEVAKLAENTSRDVNIAFANQLALICEHYGVDVKKVIELANTHPRVTIHIPGPGVGDPCLPKDPYLLISGVKSSRRDIVRTARRINDSMPDHIVRMTLLALKDAGKDARNAKVTVLGTAYKAEVADSRLSPAEPIIRKLLRSGIKVTAYDPYCQEPFSAKRAGGFREAIRDSDCIIMVTDHAEFKKIDLQLLKSEVKEKLIIIDARRVFNPNVAARAMPNGLSKLLTSNSTGYVSLARAWPGAYVLNVSWCGVPVGSSDSRSLPAGAGIWPAGFSTLSSLLRMMLAGF
jgi:UDP-N-acetyl-D-mannosaminuronic acid dehydrogenase